jgi:hypothetical protein
MDLGGEEVRCCQGNRRESVSSSCSVRSFLSRKAWDFRGKNMSELYVRLQIWVIVQAFQIW